MIDEFKYWSKELEDFACKLNPNIKRETIRNNFKEQVDALFKQMDASKVYLSLDKKNKEIKMDVKI